LLDRPSHTGLRHIAINCKNLEATVAFYKDIIGMIVEWQPDNDNYYLTSGNDNLALHRTTEEHTENPNRLDHIGFFIDDPSKVDKWHEYLMSCGVNIVSKPKTHRDGARSLYCKDPDGTIVQMIYHPPVSSSDK
tara:strand:- start:310 stop:711 length:402 start_codon:yes stop_codon:yes gene_type:complete